MTDSAEYSSKHIKIRHTETNLFVSVVLPHEALEAIRLAQVKIKSPTKKQLIASTRIVQVEKYNHLLMTEERKLRYSKRVSSSSTTPTSPTKKHVRFTI